VGIGLGGDDAGEGGLAGAGRTPEDDRGQLSGFDEAPQQAAGAHEVLLTHVVVEAAGTHARGEGRTGQVFGTGEGDAFRLDEGRLGCWAFGSRARHTTLALARRPALRVAQISEMAQTRGRVGHGIGTDFHGLSWVMIVFE
jgi:hypothetical protein